MRRGVLLVACAAVALCAGAGAGTPLRVVSLDYCADQYVLELVPRERIAALSPDATRDFSYRRDAATGIRQVRPVAEDVLALEPDLVVRSYGGGPQALSFFERAGIPVLQVPYAEDLDGVRDALQSVASGLGASRHARELIADMDRRLAALDTARPARSALYLTAGGATSGPGTLVHDMLVAAGFDNFETRPGWHTIPLERLAYDAPDAVVASFFDGAAARTAWWSSMRHPVARRQLHDRPSVELPGALMSCGAWFIVDAIERVAALQ